MVSVMASGANVDIAMKVAARMVEHDIQEQFAYVGDAFPARLDVRLPLDFKIPVSEAIFQAHATARAMPPSVINDLLIWQPFFDPKFGFEDFFEPPRSTLTPLS